MTLSCDATANPVPTISWTRNGSPIDNSGNSRISFSANKKRLTITNVSRTDSGEYRCVANNSLGNDTSNAATLHVKCKFSVRLALIKQLFVRNWEGYVLPWVFLKESVCWFCRDPINCPYQGGVRIIELSVWGGSTVLLVTWMDGHTDVHQCADVLDPACLNFPLKYNYFLLCYRSTWYHCSSRSSNSNRRRKRDFIL